MDTSCYKNGKMVKTRQSIYATSLNAETPVKTILMPVKNHENLRHHFESPRLLQRIARQKNSF
jgi:hypothetical protein